METKTYISTKEIFLKMKEEQKSIKPEQERSRKAYQLWCKTHPNQSTLESNPADAIYYRGPNPRAMNIVYGLVKGRAYKQIERKTHEHNEPPKFQIYKICDKYKIDNKVIEAKIWPIE